MIARRTNPITPEQAYRITSRTDSGEVMRSREFAHALRRMARSIPDAAGQTLREAVLYHALMVTGFVEGVRYARARARR